ncbi:EAL domain-containing protein [Roseobacter sp. YSTF-M11]|uniref:EAL domain-containing protein n=1 Tax=Roseobacter insulae TaxID=2859783 RepID=A0A9X1FZ27_9RHOB|nr:GGDEF domain-containing phosphodiesterase [Roseobacter insulae]MBW4710201.1 EAL domain-containing protein [Roseobacter insulae]
MGEGKITSAARSERSLIPLSNAPDPSGPEFDPFQAARQLRTAVWIFDIDNSCILHANESACKLWQADNEDLLCARDLSEGMSSTVAARLKQYQIDFEERNSVFNELWTLYPNGEPETAMVVFSGFRLPDGRMAMRCEATGSVDDLPENLRSAEALLHTDVMIMLFDLDGPALYMNPAARKATPRSLDSFAEIFTDHADFVALEKMLEQHGEHRCVALVETATEPHWYDISAKRCSDAVTGSPAVLVTAIDVSELKNARDQAHYLAERDQLTGCFNRSFVQSRLEALEAKNTSTTYALLYLDVDRFKQINDRFGHEMGDAVLKELVSRFDAELSEDDTLARMGGDEFVILIKNASQESDLIEKIERLRLAINKPMVYDAILLNVTISIGVALIEPNDQTVMDAIQRADIALYASKQRGRNRFLFFDSEMGAEASERNQLEVELMRALEKREFVLYFQPRYDLRSNQVVSAEALVRWRHPVRGLVMPGKFIPICEETGIIEELGQFVLEEGCNQAIEWHRRGLDIGLSINVSPRQFSGDKLMETLRAFSQRPDFPNGYVELEITETALIGDLEMIAQKLRAITDLGFRIAIDDFGTGYSNLSYITRFPLNCLKIDKSFVDQLPDTIPIIQLILTMAAQIGVTTVAEGVETAEQIEQLAVSGCEQVQGYYFTKPVPLEAFEETTRRLNENGFSIDAGDAPEAHRIPARATR